MKTISKRLLIAVLLSGMSLFAKAQEKSGKLEVNGKVTELKGTYSQRKLYRDFLTTYMNNCPYISKFFIREASGSSDNHVVIWHYEVDNWDKITQFYNWINEHLESPHKNGLKKAMTPYQPEYDIGGKIKVERINEVAQAKDLKTK